MRSLTWKERLDEYKRLQTLGKAFNTESYVLDPTETKKLFPLMNVNDLYGTLYRWTDVFIAYYETLDTPF